MSCRENRDLSRCVSIARNGNSPYIIRQTVVAHTLGPLNDNYRSFVHQQIVEINGMGGTNAFVETIEIDVVQSQTPVVRMDQGKRRAGNVFLIKSERRADTVYQ